MQAAIRGYQLLIVPVMPAGGCRFHPTCSQYAIDAIGHHGPALGGWLALKRIFHCHPWGGTGVDEVPPSGANVLTKTAAGAMQFQPAAQNAAAMVKSTGSTRD